MKAQIEGNEIVEMEGTPKEFRELFSNGNVLIEEKKRKYNGKKRGPKPKKNGVGRPKKKR